MKNRLPHSALIIELRKIRRERPNPSHWPRLWLALGAWAVFAALAWAAWKTWHIYV